jgi:23S rRNA pseudouridine2605 synthase
MIERVQKTLANAGFCSRRKAEELIIAGKVRVNGKVIHIGDKADIEKDEIIANGTKITKQRKIYVMLNKPVGYETTLSPDVKKNVSTLITIKERVFPIGRLDKNSAGLLLLTNDGDFANKVMHPRYETEKTYVVKLDKAINRGDVDILKRGIKLRDGFVNAKLNLLTKDRLEVIIHEGRKWIVKRMFFKLGYYVQELVRIKIDGLKLDVQPGKWRFLTKTEVEMLKK